MGFISLLLIFRGSFLFWHWCNQAAAFVGNARHPGPSCYALALNIPEWLHPGSLPSWPFLLQVYPHNSRHRLLDPRKEGYYLTSEAFLVLPVALSCEFCSDLTSTDSWKTGKPFHLFSKWVLSNCQMNKYSQTLLSPIRECWFSIRTSSWCNVLPGSRKSLLAVGGWLRAGRAPRTGAEWRNLAPGIWEFFPPDAQFALVRNEKAIYSRKTLKKKKKKTTQNNCCRRKIISKVTQSCFPSPSQVQTVPQANSFTPLRNREFLDVINHSSTHGKRRHTPKWFSKTRIILIREPDKALLKYICTHSTNLWLCI